MYAVFLVLGFTILISTVIPLGSWLLGMLGGMYGPTFRNGSPALFHLLALALNYIPMGVLVTIGLRKYAMPDRVPRQYRSPVLFALGSILVLMYLAVRIFASTVEGGGASFAVASLSILIVGPALIMLTIAVIKFLIGVGKAGDKPPPPLLSSDGE